MAKQQKPLRLKLVLDRIRAGEDAPDVAVYQISAAGQPVRKLGVAEGGKLDVDERWLKLEGTVGFGPDMDEVETLEVESLLQFRLADRIDEWRRNPRLELARPWWQGWLRRRVCVSGSARWCRRWSLEPNDLLRRLDQPRRVTLREAKFSRPQLRSELADLGAIPVRNFHICRPLCHGVVEIYERVCCCRRWEVFDPRLDDLLERLHEIVCRRLPCPPERIPEEVFPPDPGWIDPVPEGPFAAQPGLAPVDRGTARLGKRVAAFFDPAATNLPSTRLADDYNALVSLAAVNREEADGYVRARPYLWPLICSCSLSKVGEAAVGPDGSFNLCYWRPLVLHRWGVSCSTTYGFKVRQWHDNQWATIYDGLDQNEYFTEDEFPLLESHDPRARTCQTNPPPVGNDKPFVLLEDIGSTRSHRIASPTQGAVDGIAAPLPYNAGLLDPPGPGEDANGALLNRPWTLTLPLRLYVHPEMQALGAHFYRFSVVAADENGNPLDGTTPQPLTDPVSWKKYVYVGGQVQVHGESLGPDSLVDPDGEVQSGLFTIPYWDSDHQWLFGQFHQRWNTLEHPNGRYLLLLEIFDTVGNRLRPTGATGSGVNTPFDFLRWIDPVNTTKVPFASVVHLFWLDKQACYGDIEDLRMNGLASDEECQFMSGAAHSTFSAGFRAFHAHGAGSETFMWNYDLWYHRGLNGPNRTIQVGGENAPPTLLAGPAAESTPQTFASMLDEHTKCTFALNLRVRAKHSNGSRRIDEYDRYDQAAFALEVEKPPLGTSP